MKHDERIEQIYALLDGLISPEEEEDINTHLAECDECRLLYKTLIEDDNAIEEELNEICSKTKLEENLFKRTQPVLECESENNFFHSIREVFGTVRIIYSTAIVLVLATILAVSISQYHEVKSRFGKIAKLNGLAWCKRGNARFMLNYNDIIKFGDEIYTESDSKIHILTKDNHIFTLNSNTHIMIGKNNREKQNLSIQNGEVFIDSNHSGRKYVVRALDSEIKNTGTKFDIKVIPALLTPGIVNVAVESGKAVIDADEKNISLETGHKAVIVENRLEKLDRSANVEILTKWRWSLKDLLTKSAIISFKKQDPYTGTIWIASGKRFILPEDENAVEYEPIIKLIISMRQRLGKPIEATSITFREDFIYIGSVYGIFRYNREAKTFSLIIPDYGIIGSYITEIKISDDGQVFNIAFNRQGSNFTEYIAIDQHSIPMILNLDNLFLQTVASVN